MNALQMATSTVETLAPGVTAEWLDNRQIVYFVFTDVSRDSIDACAQAVIRITETWPADRPCLCGYDFNFPTASLTPYLRQQFQAVMVRFRDRVGRTAAVVPKNFMTLLAQWFFGGQKSGTRMRRIFFSREEALAWLREALNA